MTEETLTVSQIMPQLMEAIEQEVRDYNSLLEETEALQEKCDSLTLANSLFVQQVIDLEEDKEDLSMKLQSLLDISGLVKKQAHTQKDLYAQGQRELNQMKDHYDRQHAILAGYKELGTPKKIREKIKDYKAKALVNQKSKDALKAEVKEARKTILSIQYLNKDMQLSLAQSNITTVWNNDGDHLMLFPTPLTMQVDNKAEKQLTLLFMNKSGCGRLIGIDRDGDPLICDFDEGGLTPNQATIEKAGNILRKFKKQDWAVTHDDLLAIGE